MKPVLQSEHGPFVCSAIEKMNRRIFLQTFRVPTFYPLPLGTLISVTEGFSSLESHIDYLI